MPTVYAVFSSYSEMQYEYPPHLRGLFATRELAEAAINAWMQLPADQPWRRFTRLDPDERGTPLYVVPVEVLATVPAVPGGSIGIEEYMAVADAD